MLARGEDLGLHWKRCLELPICNTRCYSHLFTTWMWLHEFVRVNNYYTFYTYYCGLKVSKGRKFHGPFYFMCGLKSGWLISHWSKDEMLTEYWHFWIKIDVIMILYIPTHAFGFEHLVMLVKKWWGSRKIMVTEGIVVCQTYSGPK